MHRIATLDGHSLITPAAVNREVLSPANARSAEADRSMAEAEVALILNIAARQIQEQRAPAQIISRLISSLHDLREKTGALWRDLIPLVQNHPVVAYFHEDPFTRWSFEKPRGYSGDAHLIDFIYGHPSTADEIARATPLGKTLHSYTSQAPSAVAVRERRDLLTRYVDSVAEERGTGTEILTVAAGHLREADRSVALHQGKIQRWVALDQDPQSVGSTVRDFQGTAVDAIDGSVRGLLTNAYSLGTFDLIYAAGLYDYLTDKVAIRLTQKCLSMLKPNGIFLFANFSTEVPDDGYMETIMNWTLLLRSHADMLNIVDASLEGERAERQIFFGENRNIVYATIKKPA